MYYRTSDFTHFVFQTSQLAYCERVFQPASVDCVVLRSSSLQQVIKVAESVQGRSGWPDFRQLLEDGSFEAARITVDLLSRGRDAPHGAADLLIAFSIRQLSSTTSTSRIRDVVSLCRSYTVLLDALTDHALKVLTRSLENQTEAVDPTFVDKDALQVLAFLTTCFWSSCVNPTHSYLDLFHILLDLLERKTLSSAVCDTLLAVIPHLKVRFETQDSSNARDIQCIRVWTKLKALVSDSHILETSNYAGSIWLRLLSSQTVFFPSDSLLQDPSYWVVIRQGMASSSLNRRKTCLSLLKLSLSNVHTDIHHDELTFEVHAQKDCLLQYARFCTLYETIVFGRYLNQVQECLGDLQVVAMAPSKVHGGWIVALLSAAMSLGVQDSIQNLLGNWLLQPNLVSMHKSVGADSSFITAAFLPWATTGSLFTAIASSDARNEVVCPHGERLAVFTQNLLNVSDNKGRIARPMLQYLAARGDHIMSFAKAYILAGIVDGLEARQGILEESDVMSILRIFSSGGMLEIVGDLVAIQCYELCSRALPASKTLTEVKYESLYPNQWLESNASQSSLPAHQGICIADGADDH